MSGNAPDSAMTVGPSVFRYTLVKDFQMAPRSDWHLLAAPGEGTVQHVWQYSQAT